MSFVWVLICQKNLSSVAQRHAGHFRSISLKSRGDIIDATPTIKRILNKDIEILSLSGKKKILRGRALMLVRNVGHLMTTPAITDLKNNEIGEGIMDAIITSLIAMHDFKKPKKLKLHQWQRIHTQKPHFLKGQHFQSKFDFVLPLDQYYFVNH